MLHHQVYRLQNPLSFAAARRVASKMGGLLSGGRGPTRIASQTTHFERNETQGIQETVHQERGAEIGFIGCSNEHV
jgi:hypothetical protein